MIGRWQPAGCVCAGVAVQGDQDGEDRGPEEAEEGGDGKARPDRPREGGARRAGWHPQPLHRAAVLLLPGGTLSGVCGTLGVCQSHG